MRAVVAYDGGLFHGFAVNPGVVTVAGSLEAVLERITGVSVTVSCAGRTDKGVHATGQVISFDVPVDVSEAKLRGSLNAMLAPAVAVRELEAASDDFDARFSALSRTYRYRVLNRDTPDPFLASTTWHVAVPLDVDGMNRAGRDLLGRHDFASFCRRRMIRVNGEQTEADLSRDVLSLEWIRVEDDVVEMWVSANAFCQQMVRSMVGTLVEVGLGKKPVAHVSAILAARDRRSAGVVAPAQGLTLWNVAYAPHELG